MSVHAKSWCVLKYIKNSQQTETAFRYLDVNPCAHNMEKHPYLDVNGFVWK